MTPNENKIEFDTTELKVGSKKGIIGHGDSHGMSHGSCFSSRKICWFLEFLLVMLFFIAVFCVFISLNTERPDTRKVLSMLEEQKFLVTPRPFGLEDGFHGHLGEKWRNGRDR